MGVVVLVVLDFSKWLNEEALGGFGGDEIFGGLFVAP